MTELPVSELPVSELPVSELPVSELQSPARLASVARVDAPTLDDPAELYHEASKLAPATAARELRGAARLGAFPELRRATARATCRHPERPLLPLEPPAPLGETLGAVLARRRSARSFGPGPLTARELSALLVAAYGPTGALEDDGWLQPLRSAPSAGALYPLELYVAARRVETLRPEIYRFDPLERGLEPTDADAARLAATTPYAELLESAAVAIVLTAAFWRSRLKYGLRAYRFTLLETGHVAQNLLLAAAALDLAAVPLGGFYDRRLDEALGLDGVEHGALYLLCVGRRP